MNDDPREIITDIIVEFFGNFFQRIVAESVTGIIINALEANGFKITKE